MKKINDSKFLKRSLWLVLACCSVSNAWAGIYQHGTVVRMRMGDCLPTRHGFMVAFGGQSAQAAAEVCPEYTLISDKVVLVISWEGRQINWSRWRISLNSVFTTTRWPFVSMTRAARARSALKKWFCGRSGIWCRSMLPTS